MSKKQYVFLYFSLILLTVSGIYFTAQSFYKAKVALEEQHDNLLYQLVQSTDRNVSNLLVHGRAELQDIVMHRSTREAETLWRETGDISALSEAVGVNYFVSFDSISRVIAVSGGRILALDGEETGYSVDADIDPDKIHLCTAENGTPFLAFMSPSPEGDIFYYALIDYREFYRNIVGREIPPDHWVVLHNEENDLFLQNDRDQTIAQVMLPEESLARNDGFSTLTENEEKSTTGIYSYKYTDSEGNQKSCRMAIIPQKMTENGFFTLAVAGEDDTVRALALAITLRLSIGMLFLAMAFVMLAVLLIWSRRRNIEATEKLCLLQQQNETLAAVVDKLSTLARHQRLETIGTMASSIAHEFNNLLTPIMGYSIMTMEALGEENGECIDNLSEIYNAARSAKAIVSQMTQLSRKTDSSSFVLLSPDTLIRKTESVASPARPENVTMVTELLCPMRCIYGNETQLVQLFLNLTLNAFQAMADAGGELRVTSERQGERIVVAFVDTGPGISPAAKEHLFEPFFTTKETGKGTGLGLAIAAQICEAHNASIEVSSIPGEGATFCVSFPAAQETTEEDIS